MRKLITEAKACLLISIPLAASHVAQVVTGFTDVVMMGLLSSQFLASGALGATAFWTVLVFCIGIVKSVYVCLSQKLLKSDRKFFPFSFFTGIDSLITNEALPTTQLSTSILELTALSLR